MKVLNGTPSDWLTGLTLASVACWNQDLRLLRSGSSAAGISIFGRWDQDLMSGAGGAVKNLRMAEPYHRKSPALTTLYETGAPVTAPTRARPFGLYAMSALLIANAILIAFDVSRSYVSIGMEFGLPRITLPGVQDADVDRLLRLLTAGGFLAVALGIWTLQRWAWVALMIVVGTGLGEGLIRYSRGEPRYLIMLFNVLIVFYLNQRSVQRLFRGQGASAHDDAPPVVDAGPPGVRATSSATPS